MGTLLSNSHPVHSSSISFVVLPVSWRNINIKFNSKTSEMDLTYQNHPTFFRYDISKSARIPVALSVSSFFGSLPLSRSAAQLARLAPSLRSPLRPMARYCVLWVLGWLSMVEGTWLNTVNKAGSWTVDFFSKFFRVCQQYYFSAVVLGPPSSALGPQGSVYTS